MMSPIKERGWKGSQVLLVPVLLALLEHPVPVLLVLMLLEHLIQVPLASMLLEHPVPLLQVWRSTTPLAWGHPLLLQETVMPLSQLCHLHKAGVVTSVKNRKALLKRNNRLENKVKMLKEECIMLDSYEFALLTNFSISIHWCSASIRNNKRKWKLCNIIINNLLGSCNFWSRLKL